MCEQLLFLQHNIFLRKIKKLICNFNSGYWCWTPINVRFITPCHLQWNIIIVSFSFHIRNGKCNCRYHNTDFPGFAREESIHFAIFNCCLMLLCCVFLLSEIYTIWFKVGLRGSHRPMDGKKCFRCGRTVLNYEIKMIFVGLRTHFIYTFSRIHVLDQDMSETGSAPKPVGGGMQVLRGLDMKMIKPARRS